MALLDSAEAFARDWIDAWNSHNLDRVLSHYTDDFEMSSPFIAQFTGEPSGVLKGKEQVSEYWRAALARIPDLRFDLTAVYTGASSIAIAYRTNFGREAVETLFLNDAGLAVRAAANYRTIT